MEFLRWNFPGRLRGDIPWPARSSDLISGDTWRLHSFNVGRSQLTNLKMLFVIKSLQYEGQVLQNRVWLHRVGIALRASIWMIKSLKQRDGNNQTKSNMLFFLGFELSLCRLFNLHSKPVRSSYWTIYIYIYMLRSHIHEYGHVRNRHVMFITIEYIKNRYLKNT